MAKRGPREKYKKDFHPADFIEQSKKGKTFAQIAAAWNVDRGTIQEWRKIHPELSRAIAKGRELAEAWYMNLAQAGMINRATIDGKPVQINVRLFSLLVKNMFGWAERQIVKDDDTLDARQRELQGLSDEELEEIDV